MIKKAGRLRKQILQPSNHTDYVGLVDQCFLVSADALAEHVVRPALVGEYDRYEDQCDDGHDRQRVLRGRCIVDG